MSPAPGLIHRAFHRLGCWLLEGPCTRGSDWAPLAGDRRHHTIPLPRRRITVGELLIDLKVEAAKLRESQPHRRLRIIKGGR